MIIYELSAIAIKWLKLYIYIEYSIEYRSQQMVFNIICKFKLVDNFFIANNKMLKKTVYCTT